MTHHASHTTHTTHTVPSEVFDQLARGDGETSGVLRAGLRSKRLLLLHELVAEIRARGTKAGPPGTLSDAETAQAHAVLAEAHRRRRSTVDDLLLQPHVGAWATHCLQQLRSEGRLPPEDVGHLGAIAASAAWYAGQDFEVTAYTGDGCLMLPGLGQVQLGTTPGRCRVRSCAHADGVELTADGTTVTVSLDADATASHPTGPGTAWRPLRRLRSTAEGLEFDVQVDDLDPFRGCGHLDVAPHLDAAAVRDWQDKLDEAWALLVGGDRARAEAIAAGITTLVPLHFSTPQTETSATCHGAIGAVAMTPPQSSLTIALALVHEFQHTKLSVLLDLVPLVAPGDGASDERHYAPWRPDPRPLRGLLQGTYAYLGLTTFWDVQRRRPDLDGAAGGDVAHFEFALWRSQTIGAVDRLRQSGRLTASGRRFVDGMARRLSLHQRVSVPPTTRWLAEMTCRDHAISWRLRNVRPDPERIAEWVGTWLAGGLAPDPSEIRTTLVDGSGLIGSHARLVSLRHRLGAPTNQPEEIDGSNPGDLLFLDGRLSDSADSYRRRIASAPDDLAAWAGLALVRRYLPNRATLALTRNPEIVYAVHRAILARVGASPDPEELATWISNGTRAPAS